MRPEALALFVRFVRLNPHIAPNDAVLPRLLAVYDEFARRDLMQDQATEPDADAVCVED